jgi:hypothetical protein
MQRAFNELRLNICVVAAAAFIHCACCLAISTAAHTVAFGSVGNWSAAALSEARKFPAATSLPNLGLAFFAGGQSGCMSCASS